MSEITLKDGFDIYLKYREQLLAMWNFFALVTLGVVAWVFATDKPVTTQDACWIVVGYTAFALCNAAVVAKSQWQLRKYSLGLKQIAQESPHARAFLPAPLHWLYFVVFYAAVIAIVDVAILNARKVL